MLITGGNTLSEISSKDEIYDPQAETCTSVFLTMIAPRFFHTTEVFNDGKILVVDGLDARVNSSADGSFAFATHIVDLCVPA